MYMPRLTSLILLGLVVSVAQAGYLFEDNFSSGASGLWGNEEGAWTAGGGVYACTNPDNFPNAHSSLPFDLTSFTLEVDLNNIGDGGIWLRSNNLPGTSIGVEGILLVIRSGDMYWHVTSGGAGYGSSIGVIGNPFTAGTSGHVRIEVAGDVYKVYVDGSAIAASTLTDGTFASGRVALYSNTGGMSFDNVALTPEPATLACLVVAGCAICRRRHRSGTRNSI